ncbi:MAG: AMP-binding protein [Minwuia sp.]|nr:AMP-binding protein [Minwuia sp.]
MAITIGNVQEAISDVLPDRAAIIQDDRRISYADLTRRTRQLANLLLSHGITIHRERSGLRGWESGQDHIAVLMHNCAEYLEALLGAYKARAVPFNVNYRYVTEELAYLFGDARPRAIIYQARFAEMLRPVLADLSGDLLLLQVADGTDVDLLPGALDYAGAVGAASDTPPDVTASEDDIYCMYTGGTTGMPKGVLWRQADCIAANLDGRGRDGRLMPTLEDFVARAHRRSHNTVLPAPPFMHGAGCQTALSAFCSGNTVVIPGVPDRLDALDLLATIAREKVTMLLIIGDAYGRPLVEAARQSPDSLLSLTAIYNSGAILSPAIKTGLLACAPNARLIDALGASESGPQAHQITNADGSSAAPSFRVAAGTAVLNDDMTAELSAGHDGFGWLANRGTVPLGYLNDPEKTARTFPTIDGVRHVVPGDRVRLLVDGTLEFHGRESFTINSGGEKIFAEEVEQAIKNHPGIADVVVTGRTSERWGQEVIAIVQPAEGSAPTRQDLLDEAARHIARYKLPKAFLFIDAIQRGPSGKTDAKWARARAGDAT